MNQKTNGIIRESLLAVGSFLAVYGLNDGHDWQPAVGMAMAVLSVVWAYLRHRKTAKGIKWSVIRKSINGIGSGFVAYGFISEAGMESIMPFIGLAGPVIAASWSAIDNDDGSGPSGRFPLFIFGAVMAVFTCSLSSCAWLKTSYANTEGFRLTYADGEQSLEWNNKHGIALRASVVDGKLRNIRYEHSDGLWVEWSAKSGVVIDLPSRLPDTPINNPDDGATK